jgi:Leucine-rich repeat (LRR) protein
MVITKSALLTVAFFAATFGLLGASCFINQTSNPQAANTGEVPALSNSPAGQVSAPSNGSTVLNLSSQGLLKFPMYIVDRTQLQELNISRNGMEGAMPAEIRRLANLRKLNISYNQFTGLPAELGQLKNLVELDVSYNRLTGLPYELGNLTSLKRLVLTGNNYSEQDLAVILKTLPNVQVVR